VSVDERSERRYANVIKREPKIKLPPLEQIGIVVKDIDKAIEYYTTIFGWGPFEIRDLNLDGYTYRGKKGSCRLKLALYKSGSVEIELIQVLEGETPHTEFLRKKGEGLQHLRFRVDDLDKALAELASEGIQPIFQQRVAPGVAFAYIESDKIGGVMFELFELKIPSK